MSSDATLSGETAQRAAVQRYARLSMEPDESLDRITALAARILDVPIAVIGIAENDCFRFLSRRGLDVDEMERSSGLCDVPVTGAATVVVEDVLTDPQWSEHPLVAGTTAVRCYAGAPLTSPDGQHVGTLAVMDSRPRRFSEGEIAILEDLASLTMDMLELRVRTHGTGDVHHQVWDTEPQSYPSQHTPKPAEQRDAHAGDAPDRSLSPNVSIRPVLPHVLEAEIALALERAAGSGVPAALFVLDVVQGHKVDIRTDTAVSEQIVQAAARRLGAVIRKDEVLSRVGDTEFALLCPDVPSVQDAESIGIRLRAELVKCADPLGPAVDVYIGAVLADAREMGSGGPPSAPGDMLAAATVAAVWARRQAGNHVRIYDAQVMETDMQRRAAETRLRRALDARELDVAYQPIVILTTGEVVGVEALVRWHDPARGQLSTSAFLPVAEESGLIVPLGNYVRSTACHRVAAWNRERAHTRRPPLGLTANCSALEIAAPEFLESTLTMLSDSTLAPELFTIEITESTFVSATATAERAIEELVKAGVRLAIDDFGTGYASFSHLRRSTISSVKIDNSFVAGIGKQADDEAIVIAAIDFAHTLGAKAVAEGIETREQIEYLRRCDCDYGQGYYFGKPEIGWRPT